MAAPVGEKTRAVLIFGGLLAVVAVAFVITVSILNSTVYSAGGFVRSYVDALDRGDTSSALSLADVRPTDAAGDVLLTVPETGLVNDVHQVSEVVAADGTHRVTLAFRAAGAEHRTQFAVRRDGAVAGLFDQWRFAVSPVASLDVTPRHDNRFTANGRLIVSKSADLATRYTVLAPAVFELSHNTTYLTASTTQAVADTVGGVSARSVDITPKASFVEKVKADVTKYLRTSCVTQPVLLPSGCPFGEQVNDRLTSAPRWSMATYPRVSLTSTSTVGVWCVVTAAGKAHLKVGAQSLYDGHDYSIDQDIPFTVGYLVTIESHGGLTIRPE